MTGLPSAPDHLLIADAGLGIVWRLNIVTAVIEIAGSDPLFGKRPNTTTVVINGNRILGEYLYFTNSNHAIFGRVRITPDGNPAGEPAEVLAHAFKGATYDDFAISPDGTAFISSPTGGTINRVIRAGEQTVLVGYPNDKQLDHPNSVQFGKRLVDKGSMYVTTAGILPGFGGFGGGQVVKVDLRRWRQLGY